MNEEKLDYALQQAEDNFDRWNEITGCFVKHTTYCNECEAIVEDAVKIGFMAALGLPIEFDEDGNLIDKVNG